MKLLREEEKDSAQNSGTCQHLKDSRGKVKRPSEWRGLNGDSCCLKNTSLAKGSVATWLHQFVAGTTMQSHTGAWGKRKSVYLYIHLPKYLPIFWTKWKNLFKTLQSKTLTLYRALCCSINLHVIVNSHKSI